MPSAMFIGSEGPEWIPPQVFQLGDKTMISFESRYFQEEIFYSYVLALAAQLDVDEVEGGALAQIARQNQMSDKIL